MITRWADLFFLLVITYHQVQDNRKSGTHQSNGCNCAKLIAGFVPFLILHSCCVFEFCKIDFFKKINLQNKLSNLLESFGDIIEQV